MSLLPNGDRAIVEERKGTAYLLAPDHPSDGSKAAFFRTCGFRPEAWQDLALALIRQGRTNEIVRSQETVFGTKYVIDGLLVAPDDTQYNIRSVWFVETGEQRPRLVTAYPQPRR